ncbi:MAG: hypothetical protein R3Y27_09110 [Clostridia bacterium]
MKISKKIFALIFVLTMLVASLSSMSFATDVDAAADEAATSSTVGAYVDEVTTTTTASIDDTIEGVVSGLELPDLSGSANTFVDMIKGIMREIRSFFSAISDTLIEAFGGSSSLTLFE